MFTALLRGVLEILVHVRRIIFSGVRDLNWQSREREELMD